MAFTLESGIEKEKPDFEFVFVVAAVGFEAAAERADPKLVVAARRFQSKTKNQKFILNNICCV